MKTSIVLLAAACVSVSQAQSIRVLTPTSQDAFPFASTDSIVFGQFSGLNRFFVHVAGDSSGYYPNETTRMLFDRPPGSGGAIRFTVGVLERDIPLLAVDSITFAEGTVAPDDRDGDGISDYDELVRFGTDPNKKDSDGDGWDDNEEMAQFDPIADPCRFNPLVADLPRLQVELKGPPVISLIYQTSSSTTEQRTITTATGVETSRTLSQSFSSSYSEEHGWQFGVETGYESSSPKFVVSGSSSGSYAQENVYSWGSDNTVSNMQSYEDARTWAKENGVQYTGAILSVPLAVRNTGNIAYTVQNLSMTAYKTQRDTTLVEIIGGLLVQGSQYLTQPFTLNPNSESGVFTFDYTAPNPDALVEVATRAVGLITGIAGYHITMTKNDGSTLDFTSSGTNTAARTARIVIDFGPGSGKPARSYRVATLTKYNPSYTSLADMYFPLTMKDVMRSLFLSYRTGPAGANAGLVAIETVSNNPALNAYWYVVITSPSRSQAQMYCVRDTSYQFERLIVRSGDIVELMYSTDADGDGVPLRLELLYGISDTLADSDRDGLTDAQEIRGFERGGRTYRTDPARADTDGDGVNDELDEDPLARPRAAVTALDTIGVSSVGDTAKTWSAAAPPARIACTVPIDCHAARIRVITREPVASVRAAGVVLRMNPSNQKEYSGDVPLTIGANAVAIAVRSEDESATDTFTVDIQAPLQDFRSVTVGQVQTNTFRELSVSFNWDQMKDSRPAGAVLLASENDLSGLTIAPQPSALSAGTTLPGNNSVVVVATFNRPSGGSAGQSVTFTHQNLKFNTRYHYKLATWQPAGDSVYYSAGVHGNNATTGRAQVVVSVRIKCVDTRGGEGSELELYGHVSEKNYDMGSPYTLWQRNSGNAQAVAVGTTVQGDRTATLHIPPGQSFEASWNMMEYDTDSADDPLGSGSRQISWSSIVGGPSTTYSGTSTHTVELRSDNGYVDIYYDTQWTIID